MASQVSCFTYIHSAMLAASAQFSALGVLALLEDCTSSVSNFWWQGARGSAGLRPHRLAQALAGPRVKKNVLAVLGQKLSSRAAFAQSRTWQCGGSECTPGMARKGSSSYSRHLAEDA